VIADMPPAKRLFAGRLNQHSDERGMNPKSCPVVKALRRGAHHGMSSAIEEKR
jgi:hypothetical protein